MESLIFAICLNNSSNNEVVSLEHVLIARCAYSVRDDERTIQFQSNQIKLYFRDFSPLDFLLLLCFRALSPPISIFDSDEDEEQSPNFIAQSLWFASIFNEVDLHQTSEYKIEQMIGTLQHFYLQHAMDLLFLFDRFGF